MSENKKSEGESGKLNEAELDAAVGGASDGSIVPCFKTVSTDSEITPCFKTPATDGSILPCFKTTRNIVPCVKSAARAP